ncbi:MAG: galactokinase [Acidobacteriota bacterium]
MVDITQLQQAFHHTFSKSPRLFRAPGRVNLIGEHTDYNEGYVLPIALHFSTYVAGAARNDRLVRVHSLDFNEQGEFNLDNPQPPHPGNWLNYVEGVARSLEAEGNQLSGADLLIQSEVPIGGGLSSSAALEISTGFALLNLAGLPVNRLALAKAGQQAEHLYVGANVGLMDQLTSVFGHRNSALLIDCRSIEMMQIPLTYPGLSIVVCDTNVKHKLSASEYNTRRKECEQAVEILKVHLPSIQALRDVTLEDFERLKIHLPEPLQKRCRHVITENARTLAAAYSLRNSEIDVMGKLMFESHESLKNDYQVSCAELDLLVDTAANISGVFGARLTGGGFGGCTVNFVRNETIQLFRKTIETAYQKNFQLTPTLYVVETGNGVEEVEA